jgi:NAD(P)H-hydrate epimerase
MLTVFSIVIFCYIKTMYKQILRRLLRRPRQANKYDFGHVLVVGGSPGMTGAPYLAGMAALRMGAGLVSVASTKDVVDVLEQRTVELLTLRLPKNIDEAVERISSYIHRRQVSVVAIGPGMVPEFAEIAIRLMGKIDVPIVCDASAVTVFRGQLERLKNAKNDVILTPHDGEFYQLTDQQLPQDMTKRGDIVRHFAKRNNVYLVAKGHPTLIATPEGEVHTNTSGGPELATAGTGDVLTGMVAAAIAQHVQMFQAIELAVYIHGLAGELAARDKTEPSVIASDVIERIPAALKQKP